MPKIFIFDTETDGLNPTLFWCIVFKEFKTNVNHTFVNDNFYSQCSFSNPSNVYKVSEFPAWINKEISDASNASVELRLVGHNVIDFDLPAINKLLNVDLLNSRCVIRDTYVLSRLANPKRFGGHSVENWGLSFGLKKPEIEQWDKFSSDMVHRCQEDVNIQEKIYDELRTKELRGFSTKSVEIEHDAQVLISQQRRNGIYINLPRVHHLFIKTKKRADEIQSEVQKVFLPLPIKVRDVSPKLNKDGTWAKNTLCSFDPDLVSGPFSRVRWDKFNLDSPKQRVDRLLKLGWIPTEFTPTQRPKFTEDALEHLPEDSPKEIRLLGEYLMTRSRQRLAEQILDQTNTSGYIYPYVNILGAATHRMSHSNPNSANIPGSDEPYGEECRGIFTVDNDELVTLVDSDASGIQLRALAHYGGDADYIRLVSDPTVDIHNVHSGVLGCSRPVAKTFIYAYLMGAGHKKLVWVLGGTDVEQGRYRYEQFNARFPFLVELKKRLDFEAKRGYTIALDGRIIELDQEMPHKAMGVFLQSFEVIVMKRAMKLYHDDLTREGIYFKQRLIVHDEFLTEARIPEAHHVGQTMVRGIVRAGEDLVSLCPLAGEYKVGSTWAEVH